MWVNETEDGLEYRRDGDPELSRQGTREEIGIDEISS